MNISTQQVSEAPKFNQTISGATRLVLANECYNRSVQAEYNQEERVKERLRAKKICLEVLTEDADQIDALNIMGRISMDEMDYDSSLVLFTKALKADPESVASWINMAFLHLVCQRSDHAEKCLNHVLKLEPNNLRALKALAHTKHQQGNFIEAFQLYRALINQGCIDDNVTSGLMKSAPMIKAEAFDVSLQSDIEYMIKLPDIDPSVFAPLSASLIDKKYDLSSSDAQLDFDSLASDHFLLDCITNMQLASKEIEELVRSLRYCVLADSLNHTRIRDEIVNLAVAISMFSANNEYVMEVKPDEEQGIESLDMIISGQTADKHWEPNEISGAMVLITMYKPLSSLAYSKELSKYSVDQWAEFMQPLVERTLFETMNIHRTSLENQQLTSSVNTNTSKEVQAHYQESPYPRWTSLGYHTPTNYLHALHTELPHFVAPHSMKNRTLELLVAGCGTGLQAIRAAKYFDNIKVTAVDLSATSIAYARQMAQKLRIDNIEFYEGNLLDIDKLEKSFDIIECSGVLHHMPSPEEGLKALTQALKPSGLIKIGLYSEVARQQITVTKDIIKKNNIQPSLENIQQFRAMLLNNEIDGDFEDIIRRPDFFNTSGCRDLLFNPIEHLYTPEKIETMLESAEINFLGFIGLSKTIKADFDKQFPFDRTRSGLSNWSSLEEQNKGIFSTMYQFYCTK